PIMVVGEQIGAFQFSAEKPWTAASGKLVNAIAQQVAQQIENLRLLTQTEQYRLEAEEAVRRLVREEWDKSLQDTESGEWAFLYADGQVQVIENNGLELPGQLTYAIKVQGEPVGNFGIAGVDHLSGEDAELVTLIGDQLGAHLENMRLYTSARRELQDREKAEQALKDSYEQIRSSEEMVRSIIDSTPDWIFIKDKQHRYRLANKGYADALHIPSESFIGKNDLELGFSEELVIGNPEKGIRGFWSDDQNVIDSGEPQMYSRDPAIVDGVLRVSQTYKTPLRDADGNIWGVLAFSRDVSELEAVMQNLETQQRTFQAVLDNMPAGVVMIEVPGGRSLLTNKRAEELLGRGISLDGGKEQSQELFPAFIHGTDKIYPAEKLPTVAGMSGQSSSVDDIEIRYPNGGRVLLQENGVPVYDSAGNTIASVIVLQDITQARQAQETIAKRAVELATVAEVATRVSTIQNPEEMLQTVVNLTRQAFNLYHAHVYM
ncbi:MAG: PAS domain-containing protein, partial [Anaerolineaceae bacterium]|nr:PAS domain-containing protein [Anaerolineaceae bacterium]